METPSARKFKNIGHRGASGHAPENTLSSFHKAIEMGADSIELDVHLSKDGEVIVMHDPKVDRTTNGTGYIKDLTLAELKQLDAGKLFAGFQGEKIPTLQEVFDITKGKATYVIEIKNGPIFYSGIEEKLVEIIERNHLEDDVIVIAFYHPSLKKIKELNPCIKVGILFVGAFIDPWSVAAQVGADALHPMYEYVTEEFVAEAHKRGYVVHPWTINDSRQLELWHKYGVDGIASDYPDTLSGILRALNKKIEWKEPDMSSSDNSSGVSKS
jgi:glycerophosphoryl diester phosphodiesterase